MTGLGLLGVLAALAGAGRAQPGTTGKAPARTNQVAQPNGSGTEEPQVLDRVMMTVDNRVILLSEVEDSYRAKIQARLNAGEKLDSRSRALIYQQVRFDFLRTAVQAQSAWSIQGSSPARIQQIVDEQLARRQKEAIKTYGSVNKMQQEMGLLSKSAFIRERREREKILKELAEQDFLLRFRDRLALMITPKALRAHYQRRLPEMRTSASVDLAIVSFAVGADPQAAERRAREAADRWRQGLQSAADIAKEFGGVALPEADYRDLTAARSARLLPFIREFVAGATANAISPPLRHGTSFYLLKVTNLNPGNDFRWEDPAVQTLLRAELTRREYDRIALRLDREREKTLKIWPPLDRGRR